MGINTQIVDYNFIYFLFMLCICHLESLIRAKEVSDCARGLSRPPWIFVGMFNKTSDILSQSLKFN